MGRLSYWRRILASYVLPGKSQLTFWHEKPEVNQELTKDRLGPYYMTFREKADYPGPFDDGGIPRLNYHGTIGLQYNPIAIAQFGLANLNSCIESESPDRIAKGLRAADWLVDHLETNAHGLKMWMHHFDFEYRTRLEAPWYSALAQGQGISLLVRAAQHSRRDLYLNAAQDAFQAFLHQVDQGGVVFRDASGQTWLEEYIVTPPTHILNGFMWASWGLYDLYLATGNVQAKRLFDESVGTLKTCLSTYDCGYWSLYEHSGTRLKMIASPFYHALHLVQLRIMYQLTGEPAFLKFVERWERYNESSVNRIRAILHKSIFKLLYY